MRYRCVALAAVLLLLAACGGGPQAPADASPTAGRATATAEQAQGEQGAESGDAEPDATDQPGPGAGEGGEYPGPGDAELGPAKGEENEYPGPGAQDSDASTQPASGNTDIYPAPTEGSASNEASPTADGSASSTPTPSGAETPGDSGSAAATEAPGDGGSPTVAWTRQEFDIWWNLAYPQGWEINDSGLHEGALELQGEYAGQSYRVTLSYPPGIMADSLDAWVEGEVNGLPEQYRETVELGDTTVAGIPAKRVLNFPTSAGAEHRAYLWRAGDKNPRLITVGAGEGEVDAEAMQRFLDEFLSKVEQVSAQQGSERSTATPES